MSPQARRAWAIGLVAFFIVMCGMIAWSQWWAYNKNVPGCQQRIDRGLHC
jgi:DNA-binding transcriptional regulator of glucitol operon